MSEQDGHLAAFKSAVEAWVAESAQGVLRSTSEAYGLPDDSRPMHANWDDGDGEDLYVLMCDGTRSSGLSICHDWRLGFNEHTIADLAGVIADDVRHGDFKLLCAACETRKETAPHDAP